MGPANTENVGKSQSVPVMINPMISPPARTLHAQAIMTTHERIHGNSKEKERRTGGRRR
jgi:hypothetical protein